MFRTSERMIGTPSKLVWMSASCDRDDADPVACPTRRPVPPTLTGLRTENDEAPREVSATGPDSVTVREATSPRTSSTSEIPRASGLKRTEVDCSTRLVPRTCRPRTVSSTGAIVTWAGGMTRSMNFWWTATRTLAAAY